jgi:rubrerythrin
MEELTDFYNDGTGWVCRKCEHDLKREHDPSQTHSRIFLEGEAESKTTELANLALARWLDKTQMHLICPRCGIVEAVDKS